MRKKYELRPDDKRVDFITEGDSIFSNGVYLRPLRLKDVEGYPTYIWYAAQIPGDTFVENEDGTNRTPKKITDCAYSLEELYSEKEDDDEVFGYHNPARDLLADPEAYDD